MKFPPGTIVSAAECTEEFPSLILGRNKMRNMFSEKEIFLKSHSSKLYGRQYNFHEILICFMCGNFNRISTQFPSDCLYREGVHQYDHDDPVPLPPRHGQSGHPSLSSYSHHTGMDKLPSSRLLLMIFFSFDEISFLSMWSLVLNHKNHGSPA